MRPAALGLLLLASLSFGEGGACGGPAGAKQPKGSKGRAMSSESLYATRFASPRQDSFARVETRARGGVSFSKALGFTSEAARVDLVLLGRQVVVADGERLVAFSPEGEQVWTRAKRLNSPVSVAGGRLYLETEGMALEAVDAAGKVVLDDAPLPGVISGETFLVMLWPREKDFIAAVELPNPAYDEEDEDAKIESPDVTAIRATYGKRGGDWSGEYEGIVTLPPLFVPEKNRWLVGQAQIVSVDLTDKKTAATPARFRLPMDKVESWSAGADGTLVVIGLDAKERKDVVAADLEGKERWHWVDRKANDVWVAGQPPIQAPKSRVLLLTTQRVLALEGGKLVWDFDLVEEAKRLGARIDKEGVLVDKDDRPVVLDRPSYGTALADGSLLLAASRTLRLLDAGGKVVFAVRLESDILSPPVVDEAGLIYVATATQLVQIK